MSSYMNELVRIEIKKKFHLNMGAGTISTNF